MSSGRYSGSIGKPDSERKSVLDSVFFSLDNIGISHRLASRALQQQQARRLEQAFDGLNKPCCHDAVDDPVVKREDDVHHVADDNLPFSDDRSLDDAVHTEDADLRII